jgi:hypothetical protein
MELLELVGWLPQPRTFRPTAELVSDATPSDKNISTISPALEAILYVNYSVLLSFPTPHQLNFSVLFSHTIHFITITTDTHKPTHLRVHAKCVRANGIALQRQKHKFAALPAARLTKITRLFIAVIQDGNSNNDAAVSDESQDWQERKTSS